MNQRISSQYLDILGDHFWSLTKQRSSIIKPDLSDFNFIHFCSNHIVHYLCSEYSIDIISSFWVWYISLGWCTWKNGAFKQQTLCNHCVNFARSILVLYEFPGPSVGIGLMRTECHPYPMPIHIHTPFPQISTVRGDFSKTSLIWWSIDSIPFAFHGEHTNTITGASDKYQMWRQFCFLDDTKSHILKALC